MYNYNFSNIIDNLSDSVFFKPSIGKQETKNCHKITVAPSESDPVKRTVFQQILPEMLSFSILW